MKPSLIAAAIASCLVAGCQQGRNPDTAAVMPPQAAPASTNKTMKIEPITKTEAEWQKQLSPEQFRVLRKHGTERAFTGALWNHHEAGSYVCAGCDLELFKSDTKFDSGTGWPSFHTPVGDHVGSMEDNSLFSKRVEVHCQRCNGHLGHVFEDGPKPTGLRYCINSASLKFSKQ